MTRWLYLLLINLFLLTSTGVVLARNEGVVLSEGVGPAAVQHVSDAPEVSDVGKPDIPEDFSSYDGGWISIHFHPSLKAKVGGLQREAETVKKELIGILGEGILDHVQVVIGRTPGEMETLAPQDVRFPKYAAGVAFSEAGLVLLTAQSRYPGERHELAEVFGHELAHVALHDAVGRRNVPRWFNEGFAIYASKEAETARIQALWTATLAGRLIPLKQLTTGFPSDANTASVAYAEAADVLRFLLRRDEAHRFESLIRRLDRGQGFEQALFDAYATDLYSLEKQWRQDVAQRYTFWPIIFGGSVVWFAAFGLMIAAFIKRRRRAQQKLAIWAKEEAMEDARQRLTQAVLGSAPLLGGQGPVRILLATGTPTPTNTGEGRPGEDRAAHSSPHSPPLSLPSGFRDSLRPLPTIEHEGQRHTLH